MNHQDAMQHFIGVRAHRINAPHFQKMMKNALRLFVLLCCVIGLGTVPSIARAQACSDPGIATFSVPASILVDPTVPVGSLLTRISLSGTFVKGSTCTSSGPTMFYWQGAGGYLGNNLYDSGIPGIGMRFVNVATWPGSASSFTTYPPVPTGDSTTADTPLGLSPFYLDLVKTGPITSGGTLPAGVFGKMTGGSSPSGDLWQSYEWSTPLVIQLLKPTCSVATSSITVPLSAVSLSSFKGVGTTSPATPFNITLQCSGSIDGGSTTVYVTLTDQTNQVNLSTTLSLSTDSTATGVGIQVLNGTSVISYGPDADTIGNTNQWSAGSAENGTFRIPLTARYVQTAPSVTPGSANGRATFTMSYQ